MTTTMMKMMPTRFNDDGEDAADADADADDSSADEDTGDAAVRAAPRSWQRTAGTDRDPRGGRGMACAGTAQPSSKRRSCMLKRAAMGASGAAPRATPRAMTMAGETTNSNGPQAASSKLNKCSPHPSEVRPPPNAKSTDSHARCSRAAPHEVRRAHTPRQEKEAVPCEPGRNVDSLHGRRSTAQRRVVDAGWLTPLSAAPEQSTAKSSAAAHTD